MWRAFVTKAFFHLEKTFWFVVKCGKTNFLIAMDQNTIKP